MWFTDGGQIGRITPAGGGHHVRSGLDLQEIVGGPDVNVWFIERGSGWIGRGRPLTGHSDINLGH